MSELQAPIQLGSAAEQATSRSAALVDVLVVLLLVVAFFLGPVKLLGSSWYGYLSVDGLALAILVVVFGERIANRKPLFAASPLSVPILLLGAFCILELANPEAPFIRSVLGLRSWLLYLGFYFVGLYAARSLEQVQRLYAVLLILGAITATYGVYQWRAGPQSFANWSDYYGEYARLAWMAQSGRVFRAFSSFVAAGTFGGNMALVMLLGFSVAVSRQVPIGWRIAAVAAFAIMAAGIGASGSRGAAAQLFLAGVFAVVLIAGMRRKLDVVLKAVFMGSIAVVFIAFFIGFVITERFSSLLDPQAFFWKWFDPLSHGLQIALQHPFGMGLGYTAGVPRFVSDPAIRSLPSSNIDSGYGSAAAELGLMGLALFLFFAVKVGVEGFRTWSRLSPGRLRDLLLGPALFAVTYPLVSVIFQPQASLPGSIYFWLLIGLLMKAPALQRQLDANNILRPTLHD